uniref:Putative chaperone n=1 Tax=viral metagenome TaxID=1070528 RepID=A0A6H2A4Y9_9ZZZZ
MKYGEWQLCPMCDGTGDYTTLIASVVNSGCPMCDGKGKIARPVIEEADKKGGDNAEV